MSQQAKSTIREIRQIIERLSQAGNDQAQVQRVTQELQQKLQQLEQSLDRD